MPFGLGSNFGAGVALTGEPKTALSMWAKQQAAIAAAVEAERKRKAKEDEQGAAKVQDFVTKNTGVTTPKYQPYISQANVDFVNKSLEDRKSMPNTWVNNTPMRTIEATDRINWAKAQGDIQKNFTEAAGKGGYIVPQELMKYYGTNPGSTAELKDLSGPLSLYGITVAQDPNGEYSISGAPIKDIPAADYYREMLKPGTAGWNGKLDNTKISVSSTGQPVMDYTVEATPELIATAKMEAKKDPSYRAVVKARNAATIWKNAPMKDVEKQVDDLIDEEVDLRFLPQKSQRLAMIKRGGEGEPEQLSSSYTTATVQDNFGTGRFSKFTTDQWNKTSKKLGIDPAKNGVVDDNQGRKWSIYKHADGSIMVAPVISSKNKNVIVLSSIQRTAKNPDGSNKTFRIVPGTRVYDGGTGRDITADIANKDLYPNGTIVKSVGGDERLFISMTDQINVNGVTTYDRDILIPIDNVNKKDPTIAAFKAAYGVDLTPKLLKTYGHTYDNGGVNVDDYDELKNRIPGIVLTGASKQSAPPAQKNQKSSAGRMNKDQLKNALK